MELLRVGKWKERTPARQTEIACWEWTSDNLPSYSQRLQRLEDKGLGSTAA